MTSNLRFAFSALCAPAMLLAQTPQHFVVPSEYAVHDAVSYQWLAGASRDVRQQTLIAESEIAPLVGKRLVALELRRTTQNETFAGGTTMWTVTLSTSPKTPLTCSSQYAANVGADAVQVFSGPVTLPTSPANTESKVGWTPENTVRIQFAEPFFYAGGVLCVDVVGAPVVGQNANWWMADAEFEDLSTTTLDLGGGCPPYGGPQGQWSGVAARTLVPGAHAQFFAYGVPNNLALAMFGVGSSTGIPMSLLGFPVPTQCELKLSSLLLFQLAVFVPETDPNLMVRGGRADLEMQMGTDASFLGLTCTTQWLDLVTMHTSNAIEWTTASSVPTLGMALVEGHPAETGGLVSVHLAHVMRFEY